MTAFLWTAFFFLNYLPPHQLMGVWTVSNCLLFQTKLSWTLVHTENEDGSGWVGADFGIDRWCTSQIGRNVNTMHAIRQVQGMTQDKDEYIWLGLGDVAILPANRVPFFYPAAKALDRPLGRQEGWAGSHLFFLFLAHALTFWRKNITVGWCLGPDSLAKTWRQRVADRGLMEVCSEEMNL